MHYVIGDIHGCYDEMMSLINKIETEDSTAEFVFVGDFLDRGPQVLQVLDWAMRHITPEGKYRSVLGNHEDMTAEWGHAFLSCVSDGKTDQYPGHRYDLDLLLKKENKLTTENIVKILSFIESLPLEIDITLKDIDTEYTTYRIVHAWVGDGICEEDRQKFKILWNREDVVHDRPGEIIVHGHTPTIKERERPGRIRFGKGEINVDGGCCFSKKHENVQCALCALCLETWKEYYIIP